MSEQGYNGWTNYETWNLALWLGNDANSDEFWRDQAADAYRHARETVDPSFTRKENAALDLAERLKAEIEENAPTVTGFYADILNSAICSVNWYEIALSLLEDVDTLEDKDDYDYDDENAEPESEDLE